ncbi:MAG: ABC transporter ATP-binding protein [Patescibacteria group bacterium]|nr:ABC transporter ATP-binding protein [Patescibacteria group bacterium]
MSSKVTNKKGVLEGKEIVKFFNRGISRVKVLKGINLVIKPGEFIILFGTSGCGKSTLLNILLGLEIPTDGKVTFMNKDFYSYGEDGRSEIRKEGVGFISQQQNWIKALDVLGNVAFPLTLRGIMKEEREVEAIKLLKLVHMEQAVYQTPTELSSGQQQRVAFARALISKPKIVVADEPTGNLDSKSSLELMELFKDYNDQGNTVVMVTHDLEFLPYATRALNMSDGLIIHEYFRGDKELDKFKLASKKS